MFRRLALIVALCILAGGSAWSVDINHLSKKCEKRLQYSIERWNGRSDCIAIMRRLAHMKPTIDQLCEEHEIDPKWIYGLLMQESCANPKAIDYMFASGRSIKVHVGLGQLNKYKLPSRDVNDPDRIAFAKSWQRVHLRRMRIQRKLRREDEDWLETELVRCRKLETQLMAKWAKEDPRFDPRWNLEQTIVFFKYNLAKCGDPTLAIMAHHGGGNDPVRRVIRYAMDHEGIRLSPKRVPLYVKTRKLDYFKLYEDRHSRGHQYWARKGDGHLTYAFAPIAGSEVFRRYWASIDPEVRTKIVRGNTEMKENQEDTQKMHAATGFIGSIGNRLMGDIRSCAVNGGDLLLCVIGILFVIRVLRVGFPQAVVDTMTVAFMIVTKGIPAVLKLSWKGTFILLKQEKKEAKKKGVKKAPATELAAS